MRAKSLAVVAVLACLASAAAEAATWNIFTKAFNDNTIVFFDAETVVRKGDTVLIWLKFVSLKTPENDGSWATAQRSLYSCSPRTIQVMASSLYDKSGEFVRSNQGSGRANEVVPGTVGEAIMKAVCSKGFPTNKEGDYYAIANNDTAAFAKNYREYVESQTDTAPK